MNPLPSPFRFRLTIVLLLLVASHLCAEIPLYGPNAVSPMDVKQGVLGSCYFHAALAAVAEASPDTLRNAIHGDAQSGYRVHFFSGPDEFVYQQDLDYARQHNYDISEGQWVTILMRGYAQRKLRQSMVLAVQQSAVIPAMMKTLALSALDHQGPMLVAYDRAIRSMVTQSGKQEGQLDKAALHAELAQQLNALGVTPTQAETIEAMLENGGLYEALNATVQENGDLFGAYRSLGQGGIPRGVLTAFLGSAHAGPVSSAAVTQQLLNLHKGRTAMVAGTRHSLAEAGFQTRHPDWFIPGHAYTVLDYDPDRQTVTLRNPWGAHPSPNGMFQLTLAVFQRTYLMYSYTELSAK